jgi:hypothetical protein
VRSIFKTVDVEVNGAVDTTKGMALLVEPDLFALPEYTAVSESVPTARATVVQDAVPADKTTAPHEAIVDPLLSKFTVPVA